MSEPAPAPRMQSLINQLRPGAMRTVKVTGFDGADVLVQLVDAEGEKAEIIPFGVFAQLDPDVVGFPHLSELTGEPVETPDLLVDEGELITVNVAEVDLQRHRVRLRAAGGADTSHDWSQEA
ncbi:S1 RNA-binding domain-containing protein [Kitasatospora sp. NPDC059812]|uniref:S1 RNA-binding domain-containing protein n=2 Tax=Streptomycetaceae TaxID=2062 RepID=UPI00099F6AC7